MKRFIQFNEDIHLELSHPNRESSGRENYGYPNAYGETDRFDRNSHQFVKSFTHHDNEIYSIYYHPERRNFYMIHETPDESSQSSPKVIGKMEELYNTNRNYWQNRAQEQVNPDRDIKTYEPMLDKNYGGKGLMSMMYDAAARHLNTDILSDKSQTRGSQNIWAELARMGLGTVMGVHSQGEYRPFAFDPDDETHQRTVYSGSKYSGHYVDFRDQWLLHYSPL